MEESEVFEFVIPLHPDKLKEEHEGQFHVQQVFDIAEQSASEVTSLLEEVETALKERKAFSISSPDQFDILYSCLLEYSSIDSGVKLKLFEVLCSNLKALIPLLNSVTSSISSDHYSETSMTSHRNALKMNVFLLSWMNTMMEKELTQQDAAASIASSISSATTASKGRGGKKKKTNNQEISDIEVLKESLIQTLVQVLESRSHKLWKNEKLEDSFMLLVFKCGFSMLQNVANMKNKTLKECIFHLITITLSKSTESGITGAVSSIFDILMKSETLTNYLVDLIEHLTSESSNNSTSFVGEIFREIGKIESEELNQDSAGSRNLCNFIIDISERLPHTVLAHLSMLMVHLDDESYTMRNSILHCISRLVSSVLVKDNSDTYKKTRDQLLEILEERFRDTNAYTRSKVIQCWSHLCEEKAIPLKTLPDIINLVIGRIIDKSAFVRKSAIQFLITIIQHNPYGHILSKDPFESSMQELNQKVVLLQQEIRLHEEDNSRKDEDQDDDDHTRLQSDEKKKRELMKLLKLKQYNKDALLFIKQLNEAIPAACQLLDSKTSSDVIECIGLFEIANAFKLESSLSGVKNMLRLVWSREESVKTAVVCSIQKIFFENQQLSSPSACISVAKQLIQTVSSCTLAELSAFETIMAEIVKQDRVPNVVILALWEIYAMTLPDVITPRDSVGAALLLRIIASANPKIIQKKLKTLIREGLGERGTQNPYLAIYTLSILEKLSPDPTLTKQKVTTQKPKKAASKRGRGRKKKVEDEDDFIDDGDAAHDENVDILSLPSNHVLFQKIFEILVRDDIAVTTWIPLAERAINVVFGLCQDPIKILHNVIRTLSQKSKVNPEANMQEQQSQNVQVSTSSLTKLLFIAGHGAIRELVNVEDELKLEKKRMNGMDMDEKMKIKSSRESSKVEQELGIDLTGAEEQELEEKFEKMEKNILDENSVYYPLIPLIINISKDANDTFKNSLLRKCAVLSLCKFMCVSLEFCEENLQLLFTILTSANTPSEFRTNIIVSVGDMACRFPNSVEPWTHHIYCCLRDKDRQVRKNTLMVLTHLILNDMIKVKSSIGDIARCIEDRDPNIVNLSKSFFNELSRRGTTHNNPIYNLLPEILSRLSNSEDLSDSSFRNIMKYILAFITKDKQTELLVEKLCQRFKSVSDNSIDQWRALAFCISLVNISDKGVKKIIDCLKYYQHALVDDEVFDVFLQISDKTKKSFNSKASRAGREAKELREEFEEWEKKIEQIHSKLQEDKDYYQSLKDGSKKLKFKQEMKNIKKENNDSSEIDSEENEDNDEQPSSRHTRAKRNMTKERGSKSSLKSSVKSGKKRNPRKRVVFRGSDTEDDDDHDEEDSRSDSEEQMEPTSPEIVKVKIEAESEDEEVANRKKIPRKRQTSQRTGAKRKRGIASRRSESGEDQEADCEEKENVPLCDDRQKKKQKVYKSPAQPKTRSALKKRDINVDENTIASSPTIAPVATKTEIRSRRKRATRTIARGNKENSVQ